MAKEINKRLKDIHWDRKIFMKYTDVSYQTITRWEKNPPKITIRLLELLKDDELKALQIKKKILKEIEKEKLNNK